MIGLNVGSGQRPFTSTADVKWINIDKVKHHPFTIDLVCDGAHLDGIKAETVDYFVLHHVLEHFGCGESAALIREAHRVLKPGGKLLVCVPDMRSLAQGWLNGKISTQIYLTNVYGAYMGNEEDRHKWGFDYHSLADFLVSHGPWSGISMPMFDFEHLDPPGADIAHDWWILEAECLK